MMMTTASRVRKITLCHCAFAVSLIKSADKNDVGFLSTECLYGLGQDIPDSQRQRWPKQIYFGHFSLHRFKSFELISLGLEWLLYRIC
jgi:hypothetical protein